LKVAGMACFLHSLHQWLVDKGIMSWLLAGTRDFSHLQGRELAVEPTWHCIQCCCG
jgi:hypothetical protein